MATVDSQRGSGLYVSTDARVDIAVVGRHIQDSQLKKRVSLPRLILLPVPDHFLPCFPPLYAVTRFRQLTAENCSVALLD